MRYNLVRKNIFPALPHTCDVACFEIEMVPYLLGALWLRSQKYWWLSADDQRLARWSLNKQMTEFLMPCGTQIVEAIDRLYRLTEEVWTGQQYYYAESGDPSNPYIIYPDIPIARGNAGYVSQSALGWQKGAYDVLSNLATGLPNDETTDTRNFRQQLDDILAAIQSGTFNDDDIIAQLQLIVAALG